MESEKIQLCMEMTEETSLSGLWKKMRKGPLLDRSCNSDLSADYVFKIDTVKVLVHPLFKLGPDRECPAPVVTGTGV